MSDDNSLQAPSPEHLAELLPQYGVESFIAQGGMGAVYKGRQLSLDRDVAIKVLLNEFGGDSEFLESFSTEAKAMARLNHPNLLGVFDFGDIDGMPYIVMEYVDGGSLHEAAWDQVIDPAAAVTIIKSICEGLAHAHHHGIVHRDIKPSNILLTTGTEPKVADFGLANAIDSDQPGLVMGTPGYTAPEVFQDPDQAGQLADIYSVGVILHQMLTGTDPAGCMEPPKQPTGNFRLDAIWRKATNISPEQRYQTIAEMASDLEKWLTAKKKASVAAGNSPYRPPVQKIKSSSGGSGLFFKLLIIGILAAAAFFTYQRLEDTKKKINEANEAAKAKPKVKVVEIKPEPSPGVPPADQSGDPSSPAPDISAPDISGSNTDNDPKIPEISDQTPDPEPQEELPPGDPELRERAVGFIFDAREKRDKELSDNAKALLFQVGAFARNADFEEAQAIDRLKEEFDNDRIPSTQGILELSAKVITDFNDARAKEESIDARHRAALTVIRNAYLKHLQTGAGETPDEELKQRLLAQAERAEDLDSWVRLLAPDTKIGPKAGPGGFAGKWTNSSEGNDKKWIAHPEGKVEIVGENWEAFWEILADGSLEIRWPSKPRPYKYTRDGEGWTGETSFGKPTTLTRGNW